MRENYAAEIYDLGELDQRLVGLVWAGGWGGPTGEWVPHYAW